jgi:signal transduction histidine kinase
VVFSMLKRIAGLEKQPKPTLIALGLVIVAFLGGIDFISGNELSFSIFYLIPISVIAWFGGRRSGIVISVAAAVSWFSADHFGGHTYAHATIPLWNTAVRLGFFLIVTYTLSALNASQQRREDLMHFIVHDLRSPLGVVMTGLHTLEESSEETLSPTQKNLITICLNSCHRMLTLINSILDLVRLERGKMPLKLTPVNVGQLVDSSVSALALWAQQENIVLTSLLVPEVNTVYADSVLVERVLVNLLSNAIKFSRSNSTVTIRVAPYQGGMVAFSIQDQGKGIPRVWSDKVFDKFAQVDPKTPRGRAGSGLGLSFCRLAVEVQGGRIWVERGVDQGTIITFTLPADSPTAGEQ